MSIRRAAALFLKREFPKARVFVTTDLEIALEAAVGSGEGIILVAGTGSAAYGRNRHGRTVRAGGHGPSGSDEGSAFDVGRRAVAIAIRGKEGRLPASALSREILRSLGCHGWRAVRRRIARNPDDVFPRIFPVVARLADRRDRIAREILSCAAAHLAGLAAYVAKALELRQRRVPLAKVGGVHGRSRYFDRAIEAALKKAVPSAKMIQLNQSPAQAAARWAARRGGFRTRRGLHAG